MNNPTIVVNDIAASPGGGLTVLKEFYEAVKKRDESINWVFLLSEPYINKTDNIEVVLLPKIKKHINRLAFDFFTGHKIINGYDPVAVFSLQNTVTRHCKGKTITYIHQSLPFQKIKKFSFLKRDEYKLACIQYLLGFLIKRSIKKSDLNIVQTKWMKSEVERYCRENKVVQIYPNMPGLLQKAAYESVNNFFYPTNDSTYKNNELLIDACKQLNTESIDFYTTITIEATETVDNMAFVGRIPIDEVFEHYTKSCLVFPSYIETFGYPLVEARAAETIILASDCPFSHELLDDYKNAYFFDPFDAKGLCNLMRKVASGEIKREAPSENERVTADTEAINSWDLVIDEIIKNSIGS